MSKSKQSLMQNFHHAAEACAFALWFNLSKCCGRSRAKFTDGRTNLEAHLCCDNSGQSLAGPGTNLLLSIHPMSAKALRVAAINTLPTTQVTGSEYPHEKSSRRRRPFLLDARMANPFHDDAATVRGHLYELHAPCAGSLFHCSRRPSNKLVASYCLTFIFCRTCMWALHSAGCRRTTG